MIEPEQFGFQKMEHADMMQLSGSERFQIGAMMFDWWRAKMIASFPPGLSEREFKCLLYERTYGEAPKEGLAEQFSAASQV